MIKYKDYYVVFEEIPDNVSLAINITNCANNCKGCHSPELREDNGKELTYEEIDKIISNNYGINCFLFMGEGRDKKRLLEIARYVKETYKLKIAIYSGRDEIDGEYCKIFDYIKIGSYNEKLGPLNKETTNQKLFMVYEGTLIDITYKFWRESNH